MRYTRVANGKKRRSRRIPWYWAAPFIGLWLVLYFGVVLPISNHLPNALTIRDEHVKPDRFIAERAEQTLEKLTAIGPRVVGSYENDVETVNLIHNEVQKVKSAMNKQLFTMEVDIQNVSGAYIHGDVVNMYRGLQNIVVKFASNYSNSSSYLLINTHFDTKPGSPGAGDAGSMVSVMLEILRVLAIGRQTFDHPIVFLFNGGEENSLEASHGFITQHKWAKNCKAVINLDAAGSGHREILFRTSPNHPWLLKYYKKHAMHPFANAIGEEMFEQNIIPSDTDFRNFNIFGDIAGLDMAYINNGYVYHTKFDTMDVISRESLQNTGDNVLSLVKAFANAPELEDTSLYAKGHTVYYDVLGKFLVYYTESQAVQINCIVSALAMLLVFISLWRMAKVGEVSFGNVLGTFLCIYVVHIFAFVFAVSCPICLAFGMDLLGLSMTWFTNKWMIIGLYGCPTLFALGIPTAMFIGSAKDRLNISFKTQMILHSQCVLLAVFTILATVLRVRSAYVLMIGVLFYLIPLIVNTLGCLYRKGYQWVVVVVVCQIPAFLFFAYMSTVILSFLIPIMGRYGPRTNPDLIIGGITTVAAILSLGYIIPLFNLFRKSKAIITSFLIVTVVFLAFTVTPIGFPFREKTNVERFNLRQVHRVFHEADSTICQNDTGYYFDLQDRRQFSTIKGSFPLSKWIRKSLSKSSLPDVFDTTKLIDMSKECNNRIFCGFPVFNNYRKNTKLSTQWLLAENSTIPNEPPKLVLLSKNVNVSTVRYDFELSGPSHMGIYLNPISESKIIDWSFLDTMIRDKWYPPYFVHFSTGYIDKSPLEFHVVVETSKEIDTNSTSPILELGIGGHYLNSEHKRSVSYKAFIESFPSYAYVMEWPSSYEQWVF